MVDRTGLLLPEFPVVKFAQDEEKGQFLTVINPTLFPEP